MNLSTSLTRPSKNSNNKNNKACSRRAECIPARQLDQIAFCTAGGSRKDGSWQIHKLSTLRTKLVNVSKGMSFPRPFRYIHTHRLNLNTGSALTSSLTCALKDHRHTDTQMQTPKQHTCRDLHTIDPDFCAHEHTTKTT